MQGCQRRGLASAGLLVLGWQWGLVGKGASTPHFLTSPGLSWPLGLRARLQANLPEPSWLPMQSSWRNPRCSQPSQWPPTRAGHQTSPAVRTDQQVRTTSRQVLPVHPRLAGLPPRGGPALCGLFLGSSHPALFAVSFTYVAHRGSSVLWWSGPGGGCDLEMRGGKHSGRSGSQPAQRRAGLPSAASRARRGKSLRCTFARRGVACPPAPSTQLSVLLGALRAQLKPHTLAPRGPLWRPHPISLWPRGCKDVGGRRIKH